MKIQIIIMFTMFGLFSCGTNAEKEKEKEKGPCVGVEKATCPDYNDAGGIYTEVSQCEIDYGKSCKTFESGEGECKTMILCESTSGSCNNSFVECSAGYTAADCEIGKESCIASEKGVCAQRGSCQCFSCEDAGYFQKVKTCTGLENCTSRASCKEEIFCATCDTKCGVDEVAKRSCRPEENCREEKCKDNPSLNYYCRPK